MLVARSAPPGTMLYLGNAPVMAGGRLAATSGGGGAVTPCVMHPGRTRRRLELTCCATNKGMSHQILGRSVTVPELF